MQKYLSKKHCFSLPYFLVVISGEITPEIIVKNMFYQLKNEKLRTLKQYLQYKNEWFKF